VKEVPLNTNVVLFLLGDAQDEFAQDPSKTVVIWIGAADVPQELKNSALTAGRLTAKMSKLFFMGRLFVLEMEW